MGNKLKTNENIKEKLAKDLSTAIFRIKRLGWDEENGMELRAAEFFLLALLLKKSENGNEPVKASDLSSLLKITPGAVSHMINTLEEKELIIRGNDKNDRRVVTLSPTPKGITTADIIKSKILEKMKGLVELLGEEKTIEFLSTMEIVNNYFGGEKKCN